MGAIARHIVLKTPDKADQRTIAADAAASIMIQLPVMHQHQFVLFIARLARTPKVHQRTTLLVTAWWTTEAAARMAEDTVSVLRP